MRKIFLLLLSAVLLITGCNIEVKPDSIGKPYEVMIICSDEIWADSSAIELYNALDKDIPGLPQSEPSFKISRMKNANASSSKMRNIIVVDIDSLKFPTCEFRYEKDAIAFNQILVSITGPSKEALKEYIAENGKFIVSFLTQGEMDREVAKLKTSNNAKAKEKIMEMFGCEILIPKKLEDFKVGKDFIWISDFFSNNPEIMNFAMYSYPYTSPENFSLENFLITRDSVMKENIPGGEPGQYIQTDGSYVTIEEKSFRDKYLQVARGLWHMENDMMGGPFVSYSAVDEINNRVIVAEVFVYAPHKAKGSYIRELEAALLTLKLPADIILDNSLQTEDIVIEASKEQEIPIND